jgi:ribosomal protein S18 acetylase RimI-like enzyme
MALEFLSAADFGLEHTADVLTRGFADYFMAMPFTAAGLLQLARTDNVDLTASRIVRSGDVALGAALIARRGWTSRLAGMALAPEARRQGAGRALVMHLLDEAKARGDRTMVLEVIEQNGPAVKLYEACGFRRVRRLVGFARSGWSGPGGPPAPDLVQVDLRAMAAVITAEGAPDLPWQLSGETIAALTPPTVAYRLNGSWIAVSHLAGPAAIVRALVTERGAQGRGGSAALLRAVMARHPANEWQIKAIWPEAFSDAFVSAGFARTELTQWQMVRDVG